MRAGFARGSGGGDDPIQFSILPFAHRTAVIGGDGFAERIEDGFTRSRGWDEGALPGVAGIFGAEQITAKENEISVAKDTFQFCRRIALQERPAVTGAKERTVAQLNHARVLRAAERIGIN